MTDLRKSVGNDGQYASPQEVSRMAWVGVAFVLYPGQASGPRILLQITARQGEQRPQQASVRCGHRCGATHSRSSKEVVQKRFGLIVCMVCKQDPIGRMVRQRSVTQAAGCSFQALFFVVCDVHPNHIERDAESRAKPNAGFGPGIRLAAQTMMDMTSRDPVAATPGEVVQRVQQNRGIEATGITDKKNRAGLGHLSGKGGRDSPKHGLSESIVP
nr:hypothetical protein [Sulfuritalea sp.]